MRKKQPRFWSRDDWVLNHDNAPAPSSNLVQQFLAKHKIVQLRQPPCSPDIAPCDFWMFLKLKMALKGKRFDEVETIQSNATRELKAIPKSAFEDCFKMWKHRWESVVQSNGNYFDGSHGSDGEEQHLVFSIRKRLNETKFTKCPAHKWSLDRYIFLHSYLMLRKWIFPPKISNREKCGDWTSVLWNTLAYLFHHA